MEKKQQIIENFKSAIKSTARSVSNIENLEFYFLHSYMCISQTENIFASTTYYDEINSVVIKDNIYGIQFHPEKSHTQGENLLINYIKMYVET